MDKLTSGSTPSLNGSNWKELNDNKGHRWVWQSPAIIRGVILSIIEKDDKYIFLVSPSQKDFWLLRKSFNDIKTAFKAAAIWWVRFQDENIDIFQTSKWIKLLSFPKFGNTDIESKFPKGKSVDVPKYLRDHGNPDAADEWEKMNEEYGDMLKKATRIPYMLISLSGKSILPHVKPIVKPSSGISGDSIEGYFEDKLYIENVIMAVNGHIKKFKKFATIESGSIFNFDADLEEAHNHSSYKPTQYNGDPESNWVPGDDEWKDAEPWITITGLNNIQENSLAYAKHWIQHPEIEGTCKVDYQNYKFKTTDDFSGQAILDPAVKKFFDWAIKQDQGTMKLADREIVARFPPKAENFNKVKDPDGFWKWDVDDASRMSGTRQVFKDIGDIIFWLNMAAMTWERNLKLNKKASDSDDIEARFEKGVPADPTENMNPEDKKKWNKQKELNKDNFKKSAKNPSAYYKMDIIKVYNLIDSVAKYRKDLKVLNDLYREKTKKSLKHGDKMKVWFDALDSKHQKILVSLIEDAQKDSGTKLASSNIVYVSVIAKNPTGYARGKEIKFPWRSKNGDLVTCCPYAGVVQESKSSHSLNRIDEKKGYLKETIHTIKRPDELKDIKGWEKDIKSFLDEPGKCIVEILKRPRKPQTWFKGKPVKLAKTAFHFPPEMVNKYQVRQKSGDVTIIIRPIYKNSGDFLHGRILWGVGKNETDKKNVLWEKDMKISAGDPDPAFTKLKLDLAKWIKSPVGKKKIEQRKQMNKKAGLYDYTKKIQSDCESCIRKTTKKAIILANKAWKKDADVAPFLVAHANRTDSTPAKILVEAMKNIGPKIAAKQSARKKGLYGFKPSTVKLGLAMCNNLRQEAGQLASDLHQRRSNYHDQITGFFKQHQEKTGCLYSRILYASYPEIKTASQPNSVQDWLDYNIS